MCGQLKYLARGPTGVQPRSRPKISRVKLWAIWGAHSPHCVSRYETLHIVCGTQFHRELYEEHCIVVEEKSKGWLNVIALYVPRPHCSTFETFDWVDSTFLPFHLGYWYSGLAFDENIFSVIITNITITIIKCSIIVWKPTAINFIKYGGTWSSERPVKDLFPA